MTSTPERAAVDELRALLAERLGLAFEDSKSGELSEVLHARARATGCGGAAAYLGRLEDPAVEREELRAMARHLTVQESYFFRNADHFRAFVEVALPDRMRAAAGRPVRILSAGSATGEEAYTLAILSRDLLGEAAADFVSILGIDVNPDAVSRARHARYGAWSLRETPATVLKRHFQAAGREQELIEKTRALAGFEERNLVEEDPAFWKTGAFDVIFCRNVIIYFSPEATRDLIARIARSLAPGGYLFLGYSENLRGLTHEFHLMHTHETFYYRRREAGEAALAAVESCGEACAPLSCLPPPVAGPPDAAWFETISRTTERIQSLASRPDPAGAAPPGRTDGAAPAGLVQAMELFRLERFDEAMNLLERMPAGSLDDPDALLLRAAILTNRGDTHEAERICRRVLAFDELNAGAHYLMALGREQAGDASTAMHHATTAVYLDPTFAMAHLHLGRLARRAGDAPAARRELTRTLHLLAREDASRILLFGGGFHRAALMQLCEAELRACGGV